MIIEEFWNTAFLNCLARLPAEEAKKEADKATEICINHWHTKSYEWALAPHLWQEQHIGYVNMPCNVVPENSVGETYVKPFPKRSHVKIKKNN